MKNVVWAVILLAAVVCSGLASGQAQPRFHVLAFYSTNLEPDHVQFSDDALKFYSDLAEKNNFDLQATTNWDQLNDEFLKKFQLVIWLNNSPSDPKQRAAFERYMEEGGAWLGFHAAGYNDRDTGWPWFVDFMGGAVFYSNSWPPLPAKLVIDDSAHPVAAGVPESYVAPTNEWYIWKPSPRLNRDVQVLLTLDPSNYPLGMKGVLTAGDLPVAWTNKNYKMIYMNLGHGDKTFTSAVQAKVIENATMWLATSGRPDRHGVPGGTEISPRGIVANPTTRKVYAVNTANGTVTVVDSATRKASVVKVGSAPEALDVNPVTNKVYVANTGSASVSVIDGATDKVTATVSVGNFPYAIAVNPATNKIYVSKTFSNAMTVIDGATNATAALKAGIQADMIAVNPKANKLYLVNYEGKDVMMLDGATDTPTWVPAGNHVWGVAANTVTDRAYLPVTGDSALSIVDGKTKAVTSVPTGDFPCAVAVDSVANRVYVANYLSDSVTVVDGSNNTVFKTVPVGKRPQAVTVDEVNHTVYVTSTLDSTVTVLDGKTGSIIGTVKLANGPYAVAVDSPSQTAYVAGLNSKLVMIDAKTLKVMPVSVE